MCRDAQCGQGKYSSSCHMSLSPIVSLTNITNVYEALSGVYIGKGGVIMPTTMINWCYCTKLCQWKHSFKGQGISNGAMTLSIMTSSKTKLSIIKRVT